MENHNLRTKFIFPLLLLTLASLPAMAQQSDVFRLMARRGNTWQPLPVDSFSLDITGMGTQVAMTCEFSVYNPFNDPLEGQVLLPIPSGLAVSGFALETEGDMREASVVDARLGRTAYEEVVRRQIDPGLLEMLGPGIYRLRVFPLPAQDFRMVRIHLSGTIDRQDDALNLALPVPTQCPNVSLSVIWDGADTAPSMINSSVNLSSENIGTRILQRWQGQASALGDSPRLRIPYLLETSHIWSSPGGWIYFETPAPDLSPAMIHPQHVRIYWDQSASMARIDLEKNISALTTWFEESDAEIVEVVSFHLLPGRTAQFDQTASPDDFRAFLQSLPQDGASDWGHLEFDVPDVDQYILVTDGASVFPPEEFPAHNGPVYVLSAVRNATPLAGFATATRGALLNPDALSEPMIVQGLRTSAVRVLSIRGEPALNMVPLDIAPTGGMLRFCGKPDEATSQLDIVIGNQTNEVVVPVPLFARSQEVPILSLPRIHAAAQIALQQSLPRPNEDLMAELGTRYGLVSPVTSLLVLERLEDYVRFRVQPPATMRKAYNELVREAEEKKEIELMSHLDQVAEAYQSRIAWWNTEFKPLPVPQDALPEEDRAMESDQYNEAPAMAAPADEMMMEAPRMEEAVISAEFDDQGIMDEYPGDREDSDPQEQPLQEDIQINLEPWSSESSYLPLFRRAGNDWLATYTTYKAQNATSPGFFIDVANWRWEEADTTHAIMIISNLAELAPGDHELLRTLGRRLQQSGQLVLAERVFRRVRELRPEEPQSHRDLALVLAQQEQLEEATRLLYHVVTHPWPGRFPEIGVMAAQELNAIIQQLGDDFDNTFIDERLQTNLPTDLRVVLQWDQNDVDMDLWITDPRGERCLYSHRETAIGGWMSRDFTGGYGPEEFLLKKAIPGTYQVQVNYYGSSRQEMSRPVLVQVRLIRNYGRPDQYEQSITRELTNTSETISIGSFEVE